MCRTLSYEEQKTIMNVIRTKANRKAGNGFQITEEGVREILAYGLSKTKRIKVDMEILGSRYVTDYAINHDMKKLYVPVEAPKAEIPETQAVETPKAEIPKAGNTEGEDSINPFVGYIKREVMSEVEAKIKEGLEGVKPRTIEVKTPRAVHKVEGLVHKEFETVLAYVNADEPVFLYGRAGTGKNVLCKQVADALGLDFYFSNAVTQEHKLTGFIDAMGTYHETQFYQAFTNGGLFMLDEMDASIPEVLIVLNSAIANRYFDFPTGRVDAHPDFRVIGAGNTVGGGATYAYNARNQLDGASLDRFAMVEIDYDRDVEMGCAGNDAELVDFVHAVRDASDKAGIQLIISYRGINRLAKMAGILGLEKTLKTGLVKGMDKSDLDAIVAGMKIDNKYARALKALA